MGFSEPPSRENLDESLSDWSLFDKTINEGNGPWRGTFEKVLTRGDPLPLGVPFLDYYLEGGLRPGVLNVVAGRTSHGKTLLARTVVHHNHTKRILYLVADEGKEQIGFDLLGTVRNVRGYMVEQELLSPAGLLTPVSMERELLTNFPHVYVPEDDVLRATVEEVAQIVDQAERMWGAPADLIVFDYMGCLAVEGGDTSMMGMIHANIHKELIRLFDQSVWLLISQLRRPGAKMEAPELDAMFGGGEAAIDGCAIGVWRWPANERAHDNNEIMLNIMKAKQGRAYPGGPATEKKAPDNRLKSPHIHTITAGSTIYPKPWPLEQEVLHPNA